MRRFSTFFKTVMFLCLFLLLLGKLDTEAAVKRGICGANGDNVAWVLSDSGVLTISGKGEMKDYSDGIETPWYKSNLNESIFEVVITSGVKSVGDYAFSTFNNMDKITFSEGLTRLGRGSFLGCGNLKEITFPKSLESIGNGCFETAGLKEVVIPENVKLIDNGAFYCGLYSVYFLGNQPTIRPTAFLSASGNAYYPSSWDEMPILENTYLVWNSWNPDPSMSMEEINNMIKDQSYQSILALQNYFNSSSSGEYSVSEGTFTLTESLSIPEGKKVRFKELIIPDGVRLDVYGSIIAERITVNEGGTFSLTGTGQAQYLFSTGTLHMGGTAGGLYFYSDGEINVSGSLNYQSVSFYKSSMNLTGQVTADSLFLSENANISMSGVLNVKRLDVSEDSSLTVEENSTIDDLDRLSLYGFLTVYGTLRAQNISQNMKYSELKIGSKGKIFVEKWETEDGNWSKKQMELLREKILPYSSTASVYPFSRFANETFDCRYYTYNETGWSLTYGTPINASITATKIDPGNPSVEWDSFEASEKSLYYEFEAVETGKYRCDCTTYDNTIYYYVGNGQYKRLEYQTFGVFTIPAGQKLFAIIHRSESRGSLKIEKIDSERTGVTELLDLSHISGDVFPGDTAGTSKVRITIPALGSTDLTTALKDYGRFEAVLYADDRLSDYLGPDLKLTEWHIENNKLIIEKDIFTSLKNVVYTSGSLYFPNDKKRFCRVDFNRDKEATIFNFYVYGSLNWMEYYITDYDEAESPDFNLAVPCQQSSLNEIFAGKYYKLIHNSQEQTTDNYFKFVPTASDDYHFRINSEGQEPDYIELFDDNLSVLQGDSEKVSQFQCHLWKGKTYYVHVPCSHDSQTLGINPLSQVSQINSAAFPDEIIPGQMIPITVSCSGSESIKSLSVYAYAGEESGNNYIELKTYDLSYRKGVVKAYLYSDEISAAAKKPGDQIRIASIMITNRKGHSAEIKGSDYRIKNSAITFKSYEDMVEPYTDFVFYDLALTNARLLVPENTDISVYHECTLSNVELTLNSDLKVKSLALSDNSSILGDSSIIISEDSRCISTEDTPELRSHIKGEKKGTLLLINDNVRLSWNGQTWEQKEISIVGSTFLLTGIDKYPYTGYQICPKPINGQALQEGTHYSLSYRDNVEPGTGYIVIQGIGIYEGTIEIPFTIDKGKADLDLDFEGPLSVDDDVVTITAGSAGTITASVNQDYERPLATPTVTYTSSDPSIVEVSDSGAVTALSPGMAVITISASSDDLYEVKKVLNVTVTKDTQAIEISNWTPEHMITEAGVQIQAEAQTPISYRVANQEIAQIDSQGLLTFLKPGETSIYLNAEETDQFESCETEIQLVVLPGKGSIQVNESDWYLGCGENTADNTLNLDSLVTSEGGSLQVTIEDESLLRWNQGEGTLTGLQPGTTNVHLKTSADDNTYMEDSDELTVKVHVESAALLCDTSGRYYRSIGQALECEDAAEISFTLLSDINPSENEQSLLIPKGRMVTINLAGKAFNMEVDIEGTLTIDNQEDSKSGTSKKTLLNLIKKALLSADSIYHLKGGRLIIYNNVVNSNRIDGDAAKIVCSEEGSQETRYYSRLDNAIDQANTDTGLIQDDKVVVHLTSSETINSDISLEEHVSLNLAGNSLVSQNNAKLNGSGKLLSQDETGSTKEVILADSIIAAEAQISVDSSITIHRIPEYTISEETPDVYLYDGQEPKVSLVESEGEDYSHYSWKSVLSGQVNVGSHTYMAEVYESLGGGGQQLVACYTKEIEIIPATIDQLAVTAKSREYDGTDHADISIKAADPSLEECMEKDKVTIVGTGIFTDSSAGNDKEVRIEDIKLDGERKTNYVLSIEEQTASASILKTSLDKYVKVTDVEKTYTGRPVSLNVQAPADAVIQYAQVKDGIVGEYSEEKPEFVNAGVYNVSVNISGDNYEPFVSQAQVRISQKSVDLSKRSLSGETDVVYDENLHRLTGPSIANAKVSYYYNDKETGGVREPGIYRVVADYQLTNDNYCFVDDVHSIQGTLTIAQKEIHLSDVSFDDIEVTYDGKPHQLPVVSEAVPGLNVE